MTRAESLLVELRTLKGASLKEQARTIQALAERNLDLYDALAGIVRECPEDGLFSAWVSGDREKVVLAVLLAAVADDIGTLPAERSRVRHLGRLNGVCRLVGVKYEDVHCLLEFMPAMQFILDRRPGSLIQRP